VGGISVKADSQVCQTVICRGGRQDRE